MEYAQLRPGPGFRPVQSLLYYSQRLVCAPRLRRLVVAGLQRVIHARHGRLHRRREDARELFSPALCRLTADGFAALPALLTASQIADIHAFLRRRPLTARNSDGTKFTIEQMPADVRIADYDLHDVLDAPHILELANSSFLLGLAEAYIGCRPTISALGLRWSFPCPDQGRDIQAFHRDSEDWRYLKVLVYLTDVDETGGPHVYVKRSHLTRAPWRLRSYGDAELADHYGSDSFAVAIGPAGFGFAVDTSGIHKGEVPSAKPRLMLQIQYSLLPAYAYRYRPQTYRGPLALDAYVNRLLYRPAQRHRPNARRSSIRSGR